MAPDINSLPPSPYRPSNIPNSPSRRNTNEHRRPSASHASPSLPHLANNQLRDPAHVTGSSNGPLALDNTGVGTGPGPLRHPRPLTASDLHMQLEKEQEAVVNRLTRELSLLRQQSASVASTASSASSGVPDNWEQPPATLAGVGSQSTSSQRRPSSSSQSSRNAISFPTPSSNSAPATSSMSSTAGIAPPRDTSAPYSTARDALSRQSSVASRRSEASSPSLASSLVQGDYPFFQGTRSVGSALSTQHGASVPNTSSNSTTRSSQILTTARHEETAFARSELETIRKENEELKERVRDLERALSHRGAPSIHSGGQQGGTGASRSTWHEEPRHDNMENPGGHQGS